MQNLFLNSISLIYFLTADAAATQNLAEPPDMMRTLIGLAPMLLIFVFLYFAAIRPQKKREKQLREEISAMKVGDKIITIGGVVGRIVNIQSDEVTIASSVGNSLITVKKSAINSIQKAGLEKEAQNKKRAS